MNAFVDFETRRTETLFLNTAGARAHQTIDRILASLVALASENGRVDFDVLQTGGAGGLELLDAVDEPAVTAVGRELLGFIWAIAVETEKQHQRAKAA